MSIALPLHKYRSVTKNVIYASCLQAAKPLQSVHKIHCSVFVVKYARERALLAFDRLDQIASQMQYYTDPT